MVKVSDIFVCQGCGYCCQGETTVSLDRADQERLAAFLDLDCGELEEKYLRRNGRVVQMKIVDGHCVFYNDGCTVHPGKPRLCSQWPLHPSMLKEELSFNAIRESCPGISSELNYEEFCIKLKTLLDSTD